MELSVDFFSLSELEENPSARFKVEISYPKLKQSRDYKGKIVLETPYGYASVVYCWSSFTFDNRYICSYCGFSLMEDFLEDVEDDFGTIPTGEYTFEIFMDGNLYAYKSFTVTY